ncbi:MAG: glycogen synthase [Chlamydiales bacterium]|nr:glycogen synthase [Chlamydiales bacterium]
MHIVHISSELAPVAKVGGLADVVLGLSREHVSQGHSVQIILPKYDCLHQRDIKNFKVLPETFEVYYDGVEHTVQAWSGTVQDVPTYFIEGFAPKSFFNRNLIYGSSDDIDRFTYFARAALDFLNQTERVPDIIHLHDWPTALVAPLLREAFADRPIADAKIVLTIHNIEYQGQCAPEHLDRVGLPGVELMHSGKLSDNYRPDLVNLLKGGIVYSDFFTTVSPTYAQEILTPAQGRGLENTIQQFANKFAGILNGIDYSYWDPEKDPLLTEHYSYEQLAKHNWEGKERAKKDLQERLNLIVERRPLIGCVSRLVPQKGIHLLEHAMVHTQLLGGQFVLLGTSPSASIQAQFERIKLANATNRNLHLCLRTSEELAHQIFAGCDMILVPSVFEPCGLTQMIAMRYGAVPLVRRTGGLADTVFDIETSKMPEEITNGFTFDDADFSGVNWGIDRAVALWRDTPERWRHLIVKGMKQDYSWTRSANQYLEVYSNIIAIP